MLVRGNHDRHAGDPPPELARALRRRAAAAGPAGAGAPPAAASPAPTCWPAICTRRWRWAAARTTGCACRVSTSAPRSACCRPSAPSPAATSCGRAPGDRVFVVHGDEVRALPRPLTTLPAMPPNADPLNTLIARAEPLLARLEAVLPHPLRAPGLGRLDRLPLPQARPAAACWSRCATWRTIRLADLQEVEPQKERLLRNTAQFVAGRRGQQRAADRRARHRQELADQGRAERVRAARPAPDRGRQGRPGRPARPGRPGGRAARALHRLLRRPQLRRGRAGLQGAEVDARRHAWRRPATTC